MGKVPKDPIELEAWKDSQRFAKLFMIGYATRMLRDPTHGATHYHADYVNPDWGYQRTVKIGKHIFYNPVLTVASK